MKNYVIYVVLALIVGVGAVLLYQNYSGKKTATTPSLPLANQPVVVDKPVFENTISISDFTAGNTVTLEQADLAQPGFVVVHENAAGQPGTILGSSKLLQDGQNATIVINLNRSSVKGETLYVMIHADDGDGVFNAATDAVAKDNQGNPAMIDFLVGLE